MTASFASSNARSLIVLYIQKECYKFSDINDVGVRREQWVEGLEYFRVHTSRDLRTSPRFSESSRVESCSCIE